MTGVSVQETSGQLCGGCGWDGGRRRRLQQRVRGQRDAVAVMTRCVLVTLLQPYCFKVSSNCDASVQHSISAVLFG